MATIGIFTGGSILNTTNGTKATPGGTPSVGDLLVVVTSHTGNTSSAAPTDNNSDGLGVYTQVLAAACQKASSADTVRVWIRRALIGSATSMVITHAPGTTSGGGITTFRLTGMTRVGYQAFRQAAVQNNQSAATPAPAFAVAALTGNPCLSFVFNATNPPAQTATAGWTRVTTEGGYAVPATGATAQWIASGFTGTTVTWGAASASAFCSNVIEFDASVAIARDMIGAGLAPGIR
jgi:hypothetical protein